MLFLNYFIIITIDLAICLNFSVKGMLILGLKLIPIDAFNPLLFVVFVNFIADLTKSF